FAPLVIARMDVTRPAFVRQALLPLLRGRCPRRPPAQTERHYPAALVSSAECPCSAIAERKPARRTPGASAAPQLRFVRSPPLRQQEALARQPAVCLRAVRYPLDNKVYAAAALVCNPALIAPASERLSRNALPDAGPSLFAT